MRTREDIEKQMLETLNKSVLGVKLTSTSKVAIWRLWIYIVAFAIWLHEQIVESNAENSRPHTLNWYKQEALNYLDGLELIWDGGQFTFDTTGVSDIETRKIIDRVAILESSDGELVIKVAKDMGGVVQPLPGAELVRFSTYMNRIKDAGNRLRIISTNADSLKLSLKVYVDPLIIDLQTGQHLTNGTFPVKEAINLYLQNLEFNGAVIKEFLRDAIQKASGVKLPLIELLQSKYAAFPFVDISEKTIPESGYFKLNDSDLIINYLPYE